MTKKEKGLSKPISKGKLLQLLIGALLINIKNINWPIEMRTMKLLLKKNENPDFWFFVSKKHKFVSLLHLLSQEDIIFRCGLEYTKQKMLSLKTSKSENISGEKVGEDIIVQPKQPTLLDFIK